MNPLVGVTVAAYEAWNIQYEQLVEKSAKDFSPQPGLAESWSSSPDKRTWTYKLRPGLKWSDGQPLTSADIAWTINTSRKQEWLNYTAVTSDLVATAPDPQTLVIHTTAPDPKLPTVDVYMLPEHIWGKLSKSEITKYEAEDGVGSGPFVLEKREKGQFARFKANPNFWKGKPKVDEVIIRNFDNPDAMVAALERGEIDAAEDVPGTAFHKLEKNPKIETIQGYQGGMNELALNGGAGLKKPHPRCSTRACARRSPTPSTARRSSTGCWPGSGKPSETLSVSPNPAWSPEVPAGGPGHVRPRQGEVDPRRRGLQGHRRGRHPRDAGGRPAAELPLCRAQRGQTQARRRPSSSRAGSSRSASPRPRRSTTTAGSPR